jgi:hypothetical protein
MIIETLDVQPRQRCWRRVRFTRNRYVISAGWCAPWLTTLQPLGLSAPGAVPQVAQPGVVPPMPPPFTQVQMSGTAMNFTNIEPSLVCHSTTYFQ